MLLEYHFFLPVGQIAQFTQSFAKVAERVIELLVSTGRGREVILKEGWLLFQLFFSKTISWE